MFVSKTNGGDIDNPSDVGLPNVIDYIEVDNNKSSSIKILCDLIAKTAMTLKDKCKWFHSLQIFFCFLLFKFKANLL